MPRQCILKAAYHAVFKIAIFLLTGGASRAAAQPVLLGGHHAQLRHGRAVPTDLHRDPIPTGAEYSLQRHYRGHGKLKDLADCKPSQHMDNTYERNIALDPYPLLLAS